MKRKNTRRVFLFYSLILATGLFGFGENCFAEELCSNHVVISEIYGGGGNAGAPYTNDFIELYNPTDKTVDLTNWTAQYASSTSTNFAKTNLCGEIKPKSYYLIQESAGNNKFEDLPTSDAVGAIGLSATAGKVALVNNTESISTNDDENIVDFVGYGKADTFEGTASAPAPSNNTKSITRNNSCVDTNDNSFDFNKLSDPLPQNSSWEEPEPPLPVIYSDEIRINELFPNPDPKNELFKEEFVEIYNAGDTPEDLLNWKLMDNDGYTCKFPAMEIAAGQYLEIKKSSFAGCSIALNNSSDEMGLYNPIDSDPVSFAFYAETAEANYSWSFDGADWQWTSPPTPREKNKFDVIEEDTPPADLISSDISACSGSVCLNEILPNPKGDEETEYIELYNSGDIEIDIEGWTLKDKSSTKYVFPAGAKIKPKDFLTIYRKDFKFAMNNSGQENITLFGKDGKAVSSVSYSGSKEKASYNFDGAYWHWSRFLTPEKENRFNRAPKIKLNKPKDSFAGVPVVFEASAKDKDKDKLKYVWDFGDGHKSYLKNTKHSFLKNGNYKIILTVDDGSEKFAKTFSIKIKKYPKADVKIVELAPNPDGNDTGREKISLLNNSKKKINLKGWKIATGGKKMTNHIIAKDFLIEPGKIADLTKENASFYLTNTAMKLELRYPNGKTADKLAYFKDKIEEDEIYQKINDQWAWVTPPSTENKSAIAEVPAENVPLADNLPVLAYDSEIKNYLEKSSENPEGQSQILGVSTAREDETISTLAVVSEKHWAAKTWENVNALINSLLLQI